VVSTIGKYEVRRLIGRGGMGVVYLAHDPDLSRDVAVKLLHPSLIADPSAAARFRREARATAALSHPRIVAVFEWGGDDVPFIVMEYVPGTGLDEAIRDRLNYRLTQKLEVIAEVCDALGYAHARGLLHRDVKPANIRLTEAGHAKLVDFGIARLLGPAVTRTEQVLGTPGYLSPEGALGLELDGRSDLFSLATTLYEWLAYRRPFPAETASAVLLQIAHAEPIRLEQAWPGCPPAVASVVHRALSRERAGRFQTAEEFADALRQVARVGVTACGAATEVLPATAVHQAAAVDLPEPRPGRRRGRRLVLVGLAALAIVLVLLAASLSSRWRPPGGTLPNGTRDTSRAPHAVAPPVSPSPAANRSSSVTRAVAPEGVAIPAAAARRAPADDLSPKNVRPMGGTRPQEADPPVPGEADVVGITVPVGTALYVEVRTLLRSDRSRVGDTFEGVIGEAVVVRGVPVLLGGLAVTGVVERLGNDGRAFLELSLSELRYGGATLPLRTGFKRVEAPATGGTVNWRAVAIGAAVGTVAGAVSGGKTGAASGAAVGAAVGNAAADRSDRADIFSLGSRITFRLAEALVVKPSS
jgi:eukaryotic-like serine/threonine-protein kinase